MEKREKKTDLADQFTTEGMVAYTSSFNMMDKGVMVEGEEVASDATGKESDMVDQATIRMTQLVFTKSTQ